MKGTTQFLSHSENKVKLSELLTQLEKENHLRNLSADDLVARSAFYLAEFNYIHPFREGNGRMIREFMRLLYEQAGMTHTIPCGLP